MSNKYSIIFATFNRNDILEKTLNGYLNFQYSIEDYEIIIVDNACSNSTKKLVEKYISFLPIRYFQEERPGKNYAINTALTQAKGHWYVFTDDDAIPSKDWLMCIDVAISNNPEYLVFGGTIEPEIDSTWPEWIDLSNPNLQSAFVIKRASQPYENISPKAIWGPNMIVHSSLFSPDFKFNTSIGPKGKDYIMGSETEMLSRIEGRGYKAVLIDDARVYHQIRPEQLTEKWITGRARRHGKGLAFKDKDSLKAIKLFGVPRYELFIALKMQLKYWWYCLVKTKKERVNYAYQMNIQFGKVEYYRSLVNLAKD